MRFMGNPRAHLCAITLTFLCSPAPAEEQGRDWIFSGSDLIESLEGKLAPEASDEKTRRMLSNARGNAYIAGVADATSGTQWCGAGTVPPHELADRVYSYLGDLPPERLDADAATLTSEALAQSFPCDAQQD